MSSRYGEDAGHGWKTRHPLKKLVLFQHFLFRNEDKARQTPRPDDAPEDALAPAEPVAVVTPTKERRPEAAPYEALLGRVVLKKFIGFGFFKGEVRRSKQAGSYTIAWSDDTESDMKATAVRKVLLPEGATLDQAPRQAGLI